MLTKPVVESPTHRPRVYIWALAAIAVLGLVYTCLQVLLLSEEMQVEAPVEVVERAPEPNPVPQTTEEKKELLGTIEANPDGLTEAEKQALLDSVAN